METLRCEVLIDAKPEKVWKIMLAKDSFETWTKAFHPGSYFEGSWEQGSDIRFLARNEDGSTEGMVSRIRENRPFSAISIEHLGVILNGVVDRDSPAVRSWAPAYENYYFEPLRDSTRLRIEMQVSEDLKPAFEEMWPRALADLKRLCEEELASPRQQ